MESDAVDELIGHWRVERPDLDPEPMAIVGRILRLAVHLQSRVDNVLRPFGLALWGFDVLATLRRQGKPYAMTPSELTRSVMLSSGAMTNRVDRLEKLGLVARQPDAMDRRSLRVHLTPKGLKLVDKAIAARFDEGRDALRALSSKERKKLQDLLRKLLLAIDR